MDGKRKSEEEFQFRQYDLVEGEEAFDCPGVGADGESETVPTEAYFACREAFKNLKRRFVAVQKEKNELQIRLKQRDRKGSHSQVHQERDDLHDKLTKSYEAYKEKYTENEQLKQRVAELESIQVQDSTARAGEASTSTTSASKGEKKTEGRKHGTVLKLLEKIGLEVIEDGNEFFIILTDRDKLKKWIVQSCDGNISVEFERSLLEDKATGTENNEQLTVPKTEMDARVLLLKNKIEDQGRELKRFYMILKDMMQQRQKSDSQGGEMTVSQRSSGVDKDAERKVLLKVETQAAEMQQVKQHLDNQHDTLSTMVELTRKASQELSRVAAAASSRDAPDGARRHLTKAETGSASRRRGLRQEHEDFNYLPDNSPLSIPVQETEEHRIRLVGEPVSEAEERHVATPKSEHAPHEAPPSDYGATGGADAMATATTQSTWAGESDVEIIDEDDDISGLATFLGRICPMCEKYFPQSVSQRDFEMHVQQHFA